MTIDPAELNKTILLAHTVERDGVTLNVLGYQNNATNKAYPARPNAMVLPFPALDPMTQENCIDMTGQERLFRKYQAILTPQERSLSLGMKGGDGLRSVEVFESGSYTVVLAADAKDIPSAMGRVPENKRPRLHPEMFDAIGMWYPDWPVALCCWDGTIEAEPMVWWYRPMAEYRDKHFLPGLDGHDGGVPDPARKSVPVDHTIIVGAPPKGLTEAQENLPEQSRRYVARHHNRRNAEHLLTDVPSEIRQWLPDHVYGDILAKHGTVQMRNGDWVFPKDGWENGNMRQRVKAARVSPPGFGA
jgi:hypothetical protein